MNWNRAFQVVYFFLLSLEFFNKIDEIGNNANICIRGFTKWKQKIPVTKILPPVSFESRDLINVWFQVNTLLSELIWHVLLWSSLNFCSCTTWFLDLGDLVRINRAWLYKELNLTSKYQVGPERRLLDLESEV